MRVSRAYLRISKRGAAVLLLTCALPPVLPAQGVRGGADSVKVLRVVARVERAHDVELEDEEVFGASTIREVAEVVRRAVTDAAAV